MVIKELKIRNVDFTTGSPKICIPVVGTTEAEILSGMRKAVEAKADLIEWRCDFYEDIFEAEKVETLLRKIRALIENTVLLFTFRTKEEGGNCAISPREYTALNTNACRSGLVDLIDVEVNRETAAYPIENMMHAAHQTNVKVILSKHDFEKTPDNEEMESYLVYGSKMDVDIVKLAVMPQNMDDVLRLLSVTNTCHEMEEVKPLITMSMGPYGSISRAVGEYTGSIVTFGTAGKASAPGQFDAEQLRNVLDVFHQGLHQEQ